MAGERDLSVLLRSLDCVRRPGEFVYVLADTVPNADVHASIRESEGVSYVLERHDADRLGLSYDFVAGWISLTVHSALEAVGLTAAVSAAFTNQGISCNVIAGLFHDHVLVPIARVDEAMAVIAKLAKDS